MSETFMNPDGTLNVPDPVPYAVQLEEQHASQAGMSRDQVRQQMAQTSEAIFDPETAVAPDHNWVDRGLVMSCEGANHPNHRHFKTRRKF